jgi:hypothetical protein
LLTRTTTLLPICSLPISATLLTLAAHHLQKLELTTLSFNIKIAFFINVYNALVMHGFLVLGPPSTLHQRIFFYNHTCYNLGGYHYCLNDIEHGLLRGNKKPRNTYTRMFTPSDPRLRFEFKTTLFSPS